MRRLVDTRTPRHPAAAVLVLHGGASRADRPEVRPAQLSVLRMVPVARRVALAGHGRLAVHRLLNSTRGWGTSTTPVDDVRWALGELQERYGDLPVGLVGHSLGGRAALLAGGEPAVRCVVALNPWVYPDDDADLTGRAVLVVHGTEDRVASIGRSRTVAARLGRRTDVELREVPGGTHAMLQRRGEFDGAAATFLAEHLLG
ncbi:alpha/beta hydrolase [Nocardioides sp. HB32]